MDPAPPVTGTYGIVVFLGGIGTPVAATTPLVVHEVVDTGYTVITDVIYDGTQVEMVMVERSGALLVQVETGGGT